MVASVFAYEARELAEASKAGRRCQRLASCSIAAIALALTGCPGFAQTPPAAGSTVELDTVEVQGRPAASTVPVQSATVAPLQVAPLQATPQVGKTGTKLEDLPASVQIIPRETVTQQGGTSLDSSIRNVSGVSQGGGDGFGFSERFLIRGLTPEIYDDGLAEGDERNSISYSLNGVDHIEILKGPGSALLGSGPPGGTINIVHSLPSSTLGYGAGLQVGSFGTITSSAYATGPTTVDGANFRIDGLAAHSDGFRGLESADYEIRPVVAWEGNGHTVTLSIDARHLENLPDPSGLVYFHGRPVDVSRDTKYSTPFGHVNQDYIRTTLSDVWAAESYLTVTNRMSFLHRDDSILRNGDGSVATGISETGRQLREQSDNLNDFDYQFEPVWKFATGDIGHTLLTGFEAQRQELFSSRATADLPAIANIFDPVIPETSLAGLNFLRDAKHSGFVDDLDATYLSAYATDQIDVTDKFKLRISGREDYWVTDLTPQVFVPGRVFQGNQIFQPGVTYGRTDTPFSWSVGGLYKILPGISPFVGVSSSHLANFSSEATQAGVHAPEAALQYEAGVKIATLEERLTLTVAGFDVKRENVFTLVGDTGVFNDQATHGVEADLQFKATPDWTILANATAQDASLTDNPSNPAATGKLPIGVPRHIVNLWSTYDFSVAGVKGFKIGAGLTYRDRIYADVLNTIQVPAYTLFDTVLSYSQPHWDVSVGVKNITDRTYFINANGAGALVGDPRTFFAKADIHF